MPTEINKTVIAATERLVRSDRKRRDLIDSKAPGLLLRVGITGAKWSWKTEIASHTYRLELGLVSEWTITEARTLAIMAFSMVRAKTGNPDAAWLHAQRAAKLGTVAAPVHVERPQEPSLPLDFHLYNFSAGRIKYLKEVERTLRADTLRDYKQLLGDKALAALDDKKVSTITRQQLARVVAVVHRSGRERYAEKMAGALRTMWSYLATDVHRGRSGVEPLVMAGLRAPTKTRTERGAADPAKARKGRYVPAMIELGRILAIARSGAFDDQQSAAIQLLVFTAQRRRPIVSCWKADFVTVLHETAGLWQMPPAHRKTASMRDDGSDHVVPLPPAAWALVQKQLETVESEWLFPQYRIRRRGMLANHMSPEVMTRAFLMMPGVVATPHDVRRAFATHGEKKLGFTRHQTKQILDHAEGEQAGDVTGASYALHNGTHEKWPTMNRWVEYLETFVQPAIDADPRLLSIDWLKHEIAVRRAKIMGLGDHMEVTAA